VQPLIEPMYAGVSAHELLDALAGQSPRPNYEIVRSRWAGPTPAPDFELKWRRALSQGVVRDLKPPSPQSSPSGRGSRGAPGEGNASGNSNMASHGSVELEVLFRPDMSVRDGRYANNGWLQELPRQFSKLVWDNAALVSPVLAKREKLENGDIIDLTFRGRTIKAPVWIQFGQAENSITLPLGYGRKVAGRVGQNVGFDAYALRPSDALWLSNNSQN
jgi:hypothetical protein